MKHFNYECINVMDKTILTIIKRIYGHCSFSSCLSSAMATDDVKLSAASLVNDLYAFRDHYFEHHDVARADMKAADVTREMERVVEELDKLKVSRKCA